MEQTDICKRGGGRGGWLKKEKGLDKEHIWPMAMGLPEGGAEWRGTKGGKLGQFE